MPDPKQTDNDDKGKNDTITLTVEAPPESEAKPTLQEIADVLRPEEIEMAKKHDLVADEPAPKGDEKPNAKPAAKKPDDKPVVKEEPNADEMAGYNLSEEDESKFQQLFPNGTVRNFYHRMKKDKTKRQAAEAERDKISIEKRALELERERLQKDLEAERGRKADRKEDDPIDLDLPGANANDDGDPDNKPLTRADLEQIEKEKADKEEKAEAADRSRLKVVNDALDEQQDEARSRYQDFDQVMELTHDLMKNLQTYYPNPRDQTKVATQVRVFVDALARADKFDVDQYNAADMAYEIGKLHPKFDPSGNGSPSLPADDKGADLTRDKLQRIEKNINRRGTSASINAGAGRRVVSVDKLTHEDVARMSSNEFANLRKTHPDVVERLLRQ